MFKKNISIIIFAMCIFCTMPAIADEVKEIESGPANEVINAQDNKIVVVVQKQPLNERSNQKVILKRNWIGVYIQINGKVRVNPLTSTYEVQ